MKDFEAKLTELISQYKKTSSKLKKRDFRDTNISFKRPAFKNRRQFIFFTDSRAIFYKISHTCRSNRRCITQPSRDYSKISS